MKLKEWGLMRHRGRKARVDRSQTGRSGHERIGEEPRATSATAEPMSTEPESLKHRTKTGGWQVVSSSELASAEPTFMGLLNQNTKYVSLKAALCNLTVAAYSHQSRYLCGCKIRPPFRMLCKTC